MGDFIIIYGLSESIKQQARHFPSLAIFIAHTPARKPYTSRPNNI